MQKIRRWLNLGLVTLMVVIGASACSTSPNFSARACAAKGQLQTSLNDFRGFDFTNPDAAKLADILDSMANQLKSVEGAVHLPQDARLSQLGGVGHLRQLESQLSQSAQQLRAAHGSGQEQVVFNVRSEVTTHAAQIQQVADAITGCS